MSYLSPIDGVGLPNFKKYLKSPEMKNVICIPLCDGVHFQGYIVNIKEHKIIQINSFGGTNQKTQPLFKLQKYYLKIQSQPLNPFFLKRKQFNVNSCGVWLVAGMSSYLINPPEITDLHNAFDIA